ncbi:LOB domain-containing protein 27-like [Bidens hawaiensis]|uniref:LOB domain-containing protein 27-like n=1 Tax=Bidens hawaiensis TaxID=980011 RepID=UPI00404B2F9D
MTLKGATSNQACAACRYQRKRCTPECPLAPHFRPEHPMIFKNAHKLFGVRNILRILEQIDSNYKTEAMQSIIYEANMRDQFPVHGCLSVICDLQYQIRQAEEELYNVLTWLSFYKQHHVTTLSQNVDHGLLQPVLPILSCDNANVCINAFWLQETYKSSNSNQNEIYPFFDNTEG